MTKTPLVQSRRVNPEGHITGLKTHAGEEYILVRKPKTPKLISDLADFARAHTELSRDQYRQFTKRHGDPAARVKAFSKTLAPEEFRAKVKELEATVEKRLGEISKDVEAAYDKLEIEVNDTIERLFGVAEPASLDADDASGDKVTKRPAKNGSRATSEASAASSTSN
ncbi:MAG: hypothetical protein ACYDCK_10945 [Thermoplasmatota archaeon]